MVGAAADLQKINPPKDLILVWCEVVVLSMNYYFLDYIHVVKFCPTISHFTRL